MRSSQCKGPQPTSNFITKTYKILENSGHEDIIAWSQHGNSFIIKNIKKFEEDILPQYFKHSNFSSFVRQLNMYSFHKIRNDGEYCEFLHEKFRRDCAELLVQIKRKQSEILIQSQNGIGQLPGCSDSPNKKVQYRNSKTMSEEYLGKDSSEKLSEKDLASELEALQKENHELKIAKQMKHLDLKKLNTANIPMMGQKFFKLLTSLFTHKLKSQQAENQPTLAPISGSIFNDIVEHVMNGEECLTFEEYKNKADHMEGKKSEYHFMMGKSLFPGHLI